MFDLIARTYGALWGKTLSLLEGIGAMGEKLQQAALAIGACTGILLVESIYFTQAEEVRLLYVLLLVLPGALIGSLAMGLLGGLAYGVVWCVVVGVAVTISVAPIVGTVYLLHAVIVWRN